MAKKRTKNEVSKMKKSIKKSQKNDENKVQLQHVLDDLTLFKEEISKEDQKFLAEIAAKVDNLLKNHSNRARFEQHCRDFRDGYEAYGQGQDLGYYRRFVTGEPALNDQEALARCYVLLAGVHDWLLPSFPPIYASIWPYFLQIVAGIISVNVEDERGSFTTALDYVKTDLARTEGNKRSIIAWIAEVIIALALLVICLYFFGVVTGIFVFAALLTIFHLLGWLKPIKEFIYSILSPR